MRRLETPGFALFSCLLLAACSSGDGSGDGGNGNGGKGSSAGEQGRLVGMTEAHNAVRNAMDIPPLDWDSDLAEIAQGWSENLASNGCNLVHSQGNQLGENLAFFGGQQATAQRVVDAWVSERDCYTFGTFMRGDSCSGQCGSGCGHYTQVVWRATQRLGCGVADCGNQQEIWTCNYDPPGNFIGQEPY